MPVRLLIYLLFLFKFKVNKNILKDEYANDERSSHEDFGMMNEFEYSEYPVDRDMKSRIGFREGYYTDQYGRPIDYSNDPLDL